MRRVVWVFVISAFAEHDNDTKWNVGLGKIVVFWGSKSFFRLFFQYAKAYILLVKNELFEEFDREKIFPIRFSKGYSQVFMSLLLFGGFFGVFGLSKLELSSC